MKLPLVRPDLTIAGTACELAPAVAACAMTAILEPDVGQLTIVRTMLHGSIAYRTIEELDDDTAMEITLVLRGDDHLSNTDTRLRSGEEFLVSALARAQVPPDAPPDAPLSAQPHPPHYARLPAEPRRDRHSAANHYKSRAGEHESPRRRRPAWRVRHLAADERGVGPAGRRLSLSFDPAAKHHRDRPVAGTPALLPPARRGRIADPGARLVQSSSSHRPRVLDRGARKIRLRFRRAAFRVGRSSE